MCELFGRWPTAAPPWEITPSFGASEEFIVTGPANNVLLLRADPNRVAVWLVIAGFTATGTVEARVSAPSGGVTIVTVFASSVVSSGADQQYYFWWARHGPVVQGEWRVTIPNTETIEAQTMVLNQWPEMPRQFPPIKVPKCPSIQVPGSNQESR